MVTTPTIGENNWGQDAIDAEVTRATDAETDLQTQLDDHVAGMELASAEAAYSYPTQFAVSPATATAVLGAMIIVPPTVGPVRLEYGGHALIGTAGAGMLELQVWQGVGSFTVPTWTHFPAVAANVSYLSGYSGNGLPMRGVRRLDPSAVARTFFLAAQSYRDGGSSLDAYMVNTPENPTYVRAYAA